MEFSLGLVEVSSLGHAIMMLDEMLKVADVEFVSTERKLGGRLVTVVVKGSISSVTASVETGKAFAEKLDALKAAEVIARPHPEILKFINLDMHGNIIPVKEDKVEAKAPEVKSEAKPAVPKTAKKPQTSTKKPSTSKSTTTKSATKKTQGTKKSDLVVEKATPKSPAPKKKK